MRIRAFLALPLSLAMACGSPDEIFIGELTAPVVYGNDDRVEVFNHPDAELRRIAEESIVALIPSFRVTREDDGNYSLYARSLADSYGLCPDERFGSQPAAASCSGVLIDDELVLTAGHCINERFPCDSYFYVFNYRLDDATHLAPIRDEDVYSCARVVSQGTPPKNADTPDFVVVQLDRPVEGRHRAASIRPAVSLGEGESLAMIGFGSGLPAKIDSGGAVADPRAERLDFFVANLDAFEGHSGSAVFDSKHRLAGILIRGRTPDYVTSDEESCARVSVYRDSQAGEVVHYVAPIVDALCTEGWGSDEVCDPKACEGQPCGHPSSDPDRPAVVAPRSNNGCAASGASSGSSYVWSGLLLFVLARRFRRRAL